MKIKLPYLQFRFYCPVAKTYVQNYSYDGLVDELFESDTDILLPQQCTGLKDKRGSYVYEGDIVKFKYVVDPAINNELKKDLPPSLKKLYKLMDKTVKATVERDPCSPTNLHLVCETKKKLTRFFNMDWIKKSKVVGNIFEERGFKKTKKTKKAKIEKRKKQ